MSLAELLPNQTLAHSMLLGGGTSRVPSPAVHAHQGSCVKATWACEASQGACLTCCLSVCHLPPAPGSSSGGTGWCEPADPCSASSESLHSRHRRRCMISNWTGGLVRVLHGREINSRTCKGHTCTVIDVWIIVGHCMFRRRCLSGTSGQHGSIRRSCKGPGPAN